MSMPALPWAVPLPRHQLRGHGRTSWLEATLELRAGTATETCILSCSKRNLPLTIKKRERRELRRKTYSVGPEHQCADTGIRFLNLQGVRSSLEQCVRLPQKISTINFNQRLGFDCFAFINTTDSHCITHVLP